MRRRGKLIIIPETICFVHHMCTRGLWRRIKKNLSCKIKAGVWGSRAAGWDASSSEQRMCGEETMVHNESGREELMRTEQRTVAAVGSDVPPSSTHSDPMPNSINEINPRLNRLNDFNKKTIQMISSSLVPFHSDTQRIDSSSILLLNEWMPFCLFPNYCSLRSENTINEVIEWEWRMERGREWNEIEWNRSRLQFTAASN